MLKSPVMISSEGKGTKNSRSPIRDCYSWNGLAGRHDIFM